MSAITLSGDVVAAPPVAEIRTPSRINLILRYLRRNKSLAVGLVILIGLVLFTVIGLLTVDVKQAYPLAVRSK